MAKCDACGNDYDKSFQVVAQGKTFTVAVKEVVA